MSTRGGEVHCLPVRARSGAHCKGGNFTHGFEGTGDGSGKEGARIPHDDDLENVALQRKRKASICSGWGEGDPM